MIQGKLKDMFLVLSILLIDFLRELCDDTRDELSRKIAQDLILALS